MSTWEIFKVLAAEFLWSCPGGFMFGVFISIAFAAMEPRKDVDP